MEEFDQLVSDIHMAAGLDRLEASGFYSLQCPMCNKESKRTGGFKFEPEAIVYHCFRGSCDATCVFRKGEPVSRKFKDLMRVLNVDIPKGMLMVKSSLRQKMEQELESDLYTKCTYKPVTFKEGKTTDKIPSRWKDFLDERCMSHDLAEYIKDGKYRGNLLIPMWLNSKNIGFQIITNHGYIAYNGGNTNLIYSPEGRVTMSDTVLLVEGLVDAACFPDTVAIMGNRINPEQAYHLRGRNVIMLPDRSGGNEFHHQFHKYGWGLCVPPWKEKDLNEAVCRYGLFQVAKMIKENTHYDRIKGEAAHRIWTRG